MEQQRRRSPRYRADWRARYRKDATSVWRGCWVIDISWEGAALELEGVAEDEALVGQFTVVLDSVSDGEDGVELNAEIRHRFRTPLGRVIVGVEFSPLNPEQLRRLRLLMGLRTVE
jgi:hypothetical protein